MRLNELVTRHAEPLSKVADEFFAQWGTHQRDNSQTS